MTYKKNLTWIGALTVVVATSWLSIGYAQSKPLSKGQLVNMARQQAKIQQTAIIKTIKKAPVKPGGGSAKKCWARQQQLLERWKVCFNRCSSNPPAGSPLHNFYTASNTQLVAYCGDKTLQQCAQDTAKDHAQYCKESLCKLSNMTVQYKKCQKLKGTGVKDLKH